MSAVAAATIGAAVIGTAGSALISKNAAKKASNAQVQSAEMGVAEQQRQFDRIQGLLSPWVQGGSPAFQQMMALAGVGQQASPGTGGTQDWGAYLAQNPDVAAEAARVVSRGEWGSPEEYAQFHYGNTGASEGRVVPMTGGTPATAATNGAQAQAQAIAGLEGSPIFQALARQGEQAMLQNASATGGVRGGNIHGALAQFRPALLNQFIEQQFQRLGTISNAGQNAATGVGNFGQGAAANIGNLYGQQGAAQAGNALAQGQAMGQFANLPSQIIGAIQGGGGFGGSGAPSFFGGGYTNYNGGTNMTGAINNIKF